LERAMGIEPTCEAWKASVLPLNYARCRTKRRFLTPSPIAGNAGS
jgi:hypothetical protein